MKRTHLNGKEVAQAYRMKNRGVKTKAIAEILGAPVSTVGSALRSLERYMKNGAPKKQPRHAFVDAMKLIKQEPAQPTTVTEVLDTEKKKVDHVALLEKAFETMQETIADFIELAVTEKVALIENENKQLKKRIEELEPLIQNAKRSNWATNLRSHLGAIRGN